MNCQECGKEIINGGRKYCCKACRRKPIQRNTYYRQRDIGTQRKIEYVIKFGGKCQICNYAKNLAALTFHHIDPSQKEFSLDSRRFGNHSIKTIEVELAKCQLLCHNCHMELHHPDYNDWAE